MGFGDFYILYLLFFIYTCKLGIPGLLTDGSAKFLTFSKLTNNTWQLPRRIYEFYFIVVIFFSLMMMMMGVIIVIIILVLLIILVLKMTKKYQIT